MIPENKGNSNFDSNWNLSIGAWNMPLESTLVFSALHSHFFEVQIINRCRTSFSNTFSLCISHKETTLHNHSYSRQYKCFINCNLQSYWKKSRRLKIIRDCNRITNVIFLRILNSITSWVKFLATLELIAILDTKEPNTREIRGTILILTSIHDIK